MKDSAVEKIFSYRIGVLLTCHNRKDKTLNCLTQLFGAALPEGYEIDVYLVDDGSTDGTGSAVKGRFPKVRVINGDGTLYWNQGMRLAWEQASKKQDYDFYLWLNDDTLLSPFAIDELLQCNYEALLKDGKSGIITGACKAFTDSEEFSYGGNTDLGAVVPDGKLQSCRYINGNAVIVPKPIFEKLGNLSSAYTHAMGDFDYGLRAIHAGYKCYTTKNYIAVCPKNIGIPAWCNPKTPLRERWKLMYSPTGLNLKEYITFRKKFWGWGWIIFTLKVYLKVLWPTFYFRISKK